MIPPGIDEGRYTVCVDCGREIAMGRLEALPYTSSCIDCAESSGG